MSKNLKAISIILFIFILFLGINYSQATEENLESDVAPISEENLEETSTTEDAEAEEAAEQLTSTLNTLSTSSVTKVSTVNSYDQANLQLNNILSIILISIGVLLILFAIAILIRLKK